MTASGVVHFQPKESKKLWVSASLHLCCHTLLPWGVKSLWKLQEEQDHWVYLWRQQNRKWLILSVFWEGGICLSTHVNEYKWVFISLSYKKHQRLMELYYHFHNIPHCHLKAPRTFNNWILSGYRLKYEGCWLVFLSPDGFSPSLSQFSVQLFLFSMRSLLPISFKIISPIFTLIFWLIICMALCNTNVSIYGLWLVPSFSLHINITFMW